MASKQSTKKETNGNAALSEKHMPNGEPPHSQFLEHLQSYPVVSDTLSHLTAHLSSASQNPYTATPIRLVTSAFASARDRFYAPAAPYLAGPYSVLSPYLQRADELGDSGLSRFEQRFPIVREDTERVRGLAAEAVGAPMAAVRRGRDYLWDTYAKERGEVGVGGVVGFGVAVVRTEWRIAVDAVGVAMRWWAVEKGELKQKREQHAAKKKKAHGGAQGAGMN